MLKAMESAGKQMENEELREVMKDAGLGTPATRAATIERLKKVGYIEMKGKKILITEKGKMAIDLIRHAGVDLLASPEMTGQWERRLHQISKGEAAQEKFMDNVKRFTLSIIDKVRQQPPAPADAFGEEARGKRAAGKEGARSARASGRTVAKGWGVLHQDAVVTLEAQRWSKQHHQQVVLREQQVPLHAALPTDPQAFQ